MSSIKRKVNSQSRLNQDFSQSDSFNNSSNIAKKLDKTLKEQKVPHVLNWEDIPLWTKTPSLIHQSKTDKIQEVVLLMAYLGLRVSEAISFDWNQQIKHESTWGFKVLGKGNKQRVVYNVFQNEYILTKAALCLKDPNFVFLSRFSVGRSGVYDHLQRQAKKLSWSWTPTPHDFRRSFATRLIAEKEINPVALQWLLGHSFQVTTEKYIRKDPRLLVALLKKNKLL